MAIAANLGASLAQPNYSNCLAGPKGADQALEPAADNATLRSWSVFDKFRIGTYHVCSWVARIILLAIAAIYPWWYGGAQWQSQQLLIWLGMAVAACTWLSILCAPRRSAGCTSVSIVMTVFLLLTCLQIIPLPASLATQLSGANRFIAWAIQAGEEPGNTAATATPDSTDNDSERQWFGAGQQRTVSVHPQLTRASLATLAVAAITLWSSSVLFIHTRWAVAACTVLSVSGLFNGFLGLLQSVSWGNWTLLAMPSVDTCFATFVSRNSAPAFYATAAGATFTLLGIAFRAQKRKRRKEYRVTYPGTSLLGRLRNRLEDVFIDLNSLAVTCIFVAAFMFVATMATFSRGGILAALGAGLITLCMTLGGRSGIARASALAAALAVAVSGMLALFELGSGIASRFDELEESLVRGNDGRLAAWGYTLYALPSYVLAGSGFGTYSFALLPFHSGTPSVWFHHAENLPLEILLVSGLPGFLLALYVCYLIVIQLQRQSGTLKEELLVVAVMFASAAIGLQALVDFSLILPGVFLPYCLLLGAFLGRCRRIDIEQARKQQLGEAAHDARKAFGKPKEDQESTHQRQKLLAHTGIAVVAIVAILVGLGSLNGFAAAERLNDKFEELRNEKKLLANTTAEELESELHRISDELTEHVSKFEGKYSQHPEVALRIGEIQLYLWRIRVAMRDDWGAASVPDRWRQSNPQLLSSLLRLSATGNNKEPALESVLNLLTADREGLALASASLANFRTALVACPMDARAAWGIVCANTGSLNRGIHQTALFLLETLGRNNPVMLSKTAVMAFQERDTATGLKLLQTVISLWPEFFKHQQFDAVAPHLTGAQLLQLMPDDIVLQARVARRLSSIQGVEKATYLAIVDHLRGSVGEAEPTTPEGWLDLAWVAEQSEGAESSFKILRAGAMQSIDHFGLHMALAQKYDELGQRDKAIKVLDEFKKRSPTLDESRQIDEQRNKWSK